MSDRPRIVYMGTPEFAIAGLRALLEKGHRVVAVITAPDRPAGRGRKLKLSPVKEFALERGLPVLQPEKLRDQDFLNRLYSLKPDIQVVVAFRMLPRAVWSIPSLGTFNLHASLLPQYRGAAPINWAIIHGEERTGVTTFMIDEHIDTGDILLQREAPILESDNAGSLHDRLMELGAGLITETVEGLWKGTLTPRPQPGSEGAVLKPAPKLFRDDCKLDWTLPAPAIRNRIRGLSPFPGAWSTLEYNGERKDVKVYQARIELRKPDSPPGETFIREGELWITASDGYVIPGIIQLPGRRRMNTDELLKGWDLPGNARFV